MNNAVKVNLRVQPALVVGWLADDPGDWVFTLCKQGMEMLLKRKLEEGQNLQVEFSAEICENKT